MSQRLHPGVYEDLITTSLARAIDEAHSASWWTSRDHCDATLRPELLARHVYRVVRAHLAAIKGDEKEVAQKQVALTNHILRALQEASPHASDLAVDHVSDAASLLLEARPPSPVPIERVAARRPHLSLRETGLLVNGRRDYRVGAELEREIATADRVDLICAFVRWAGFRLLQRELESLVRRGGKIRVITTVYTGSTEQRALDSLVALGANVKVSYETSQTRLHAKAWLFHRNTGLSTAYVGSSNLTHSALVDGLEWNVRLASGDNPDVVERVAATFEQYWNEAEFFDYEPARDGERLSRALRAERSGDAESLAQTWSALRIDVEPKPHQQHMLEELAAERERGHFKNLVVAATGTGKTWVSAFDYRRLREQGFERLLFVAHRDEILRQSQQVFEVVLGQPGFGERLVGGEVPKQGTHVFASIQSLSRVIDDIEPNAFDVLIVDEFHHASAPTYRRLLERLTPRVLLGLTATPERADGASILGYFDGRIASEARLWHALDQGLLCPFHYFGVGDGTDLSAVRFVRGKYDLGELENVLTGDDARVRAILRALRDYVHDSQSMRALGFCVGVKHAELMAKRFNEAGLSAIALHGDSPDEVRRSAVSRLRAGQVRVIFTVDLFNEGVDIPEVDTLLMLRPTESATVFLQQLGRGLRWARGKSVLTVLDFIGVAHAQFRFDVRYRALLGTTGKQTKAAIENDFPLLPPGCSVQLEARAKEIVLENVKRSLANARSAMVEDMRALGPGVRLARFLDETGYELADVYARQHAKHTYAGLLRDAGLLERNEATDDLLDKVPARMLHVDDPERLEHWLTWLRAPRPPAPASIDTREGRLQLMLFAALGHRRRSVLELPQAFDELWAHPTARNELAQLFEVLADRARSQAKPVDTAWPVPIASHASYGLFEIMAAFGATGDKGSLVQLQTGAYWVEKHQTDLMFVTLEKSEADFTPTTRYQDYPISLTQFHIESQNTLDASTRTGRRYVEHVQRGSRVLLFVRERQRGSREEIMPYVSLGFVRYVRHDGEKPMRIIWELERPMPAGLYQDAKVAAG